MAVGTHAESAITVQQQWCAAAVEAAERPNGDASPVAAAPPPCEHDYSCPICLGLLLRPVKLTCGHRFCRGCWLRVLQSRGIRATDRLTGSVACPLGRCEVRPLVPEVDQAHARKLESFFGVEAGSDRASAHALANEERGVAEVNAWAAAGSRLTTTPDDAAHDAAAAVLQLRVSELNARYCVKRAVGMWACMGMWEWVSACTDGGGAAPEAAIPLWPEPPSR